MLALSNRPLPLMVEVQLTPIKHACETLARYCRLKYSHTRCKAHLYPVARDTFNKYIRLRDKDEPCISCGYISDGKNSRQWHAGHYRPAGQNTALRFDERNVHKQCEQCNRRKSGNLVHYRENLITKIGVVTVAILESEKSTKKWSVEELQEVIRTYKQKIKDLE